MKPKLLKWWTEALTRRYITEGHKKVRDWYCGCFLSFPKLFLLIIKQIAIRNVGGFKVTHAAKSQTFVKEYLYFAFLTVWQVA